MNERDLFIRVLEIPDAAARRAFLAEACGQDPALHQRLTELVAAHESHPSEWLRPPAESGGETTDLGSAAGSSPSDPREAIRPYLSPSTRRDSLGRLGQYEVLRILGAGGFGIVVAAFDEALHRQVAIKIMHSEMARTSPPRKRFLREARAAAAVKHESIVQIYSVHEEPLPHLVMEFIDGLTLQSYMDATGPIDPQEVRSFGRQIALGLAAAHEKGLIHRDIKPANLLLEQGREPRLKLTDFGLARTVDAASITQSGVIAGTPLYMSPEQVKGEPLDPRTDLFSLGSVLYAMVTGHSPFRAPTTLAVMKRVADDTPRPITENFPETPAFLISIIERLLEKNPANRFASAREVAEALASGSAARPEATAEKPRQALLRPILAIAGLLALAAIAVWGFGRFPDRDNTNLSVPSPSPPGLSVSPSFPLGTLIVTSSADDGREGTLRWAVEQANHIQGENAIAFDPEVFREPATITLHQGELRLIDVGLTTIRGPAAGLTISAAKKSKVFFVGDLTYPPRGPGAKLLLENLTIAEGVSDLWHPHGGAILCGSSCEVTLRNCTVKNSDAPYRHPQSHQGGGGGLFNYSGNVSLVNCTFTNNGSDEGAAIKNDAGTLTIINCTFAANRGRPALFSGSGGKISIYNSIFANNEEGNFTPTDTPFIGDGNMVDDDSDTGGNSLRQTDPRLGPLGRHGGPTETFPLTAGSPAINFGLKEKFPSDLATDQRGQPRIRRGHIDCGAFELQ